MQTVASAVITLIKVWWRDHAGWFAAHDRTTALGVFESIVLKASDPERPLRDSGLKAPRKKEGLREIDL